MHYRCASDAKWALVGNVEQSDCENWIYQFGRAHPVLKCVSFGTDRSAISFRKTFHCGPVRFYANYCRRNLMPSQEWRLSSIRAPMALELWRRIKWHTFNTIHVQYVVSADVPLCWHRTSTIHTKCGLKAKQNYACQHGSCLDTWSRADEIHHIFKPDKRKYVDICLSLFHTDESFSFVPRSMCMGPFISCVVFPSIVVSIWFYSRVIHAAEVFIRKYFISSRLLLWLSRAKYICSICVCGSFQNTIYTLVLTEIRTLCMSPKHFKGITSTKFNWFHKMLRDASNAGLPSANTIAEYQSECYIYIFSWTQFGFTLPHLPLNWATAEST